MAVTIQTLAVGSQREMSHLLTGESVIPNKGLTVNDTFLPVCNPGRAAHAW